MVECFKKHMITIISISLIVLAIIIISAIAATRTSDNKEKEDSKILTILKKNSEIKRPNIKLDAEMEFVKMENNMTGIIISDPFASKFHIQFTMNYGAYIDSIPGISHFSEHMVLQSSQKYNNSLYPFTNSFGGIINSEINAMTYGCFQSFYVYLQYNIIFEKAMDLMAESFRYPLYSQEFIKNEIQAVNHEFYDNVGTNAVGEELVRLLSSNKTSFNGITCGNNQTLDPSKSEQFSKKLKGYHMVTKNPKDIFFVLYSNKTIKESEEIAKKYLNYKMHVFPDSEIDIKDKEKLEQNIKDIKNKEIFDDTLYNHGYYYNTIYKSNTLSIYYYIGKVDIIKLKFNFILYLKYLFNSEYLMKVLRDKNYIVMNNNIEVIGDPLLENNIFFKVVLILTENGLNNINDILVIINQYIDIIKKEGYQRIYFENFVKFINNKIILNFNKQKFTTGDSFLELSLNQAYCGFENLLLAGKLTNDDYNEQLLKEHLELINFKKSFYAVNSKKPIDELNLDEILMNYETKTLKYFDTDYIIGKIPDDVLNKLNNTSITNEDLKIRNINKYFSAKYNDTVIPCYKEKENKCKEKNEFDLVKDVQYSPTKYEESNEVYETYYQIDKSSESHLVYSNIKIDLNRMDDDEYIQLIFYFEQFYMKYLFKEFSEIPEMFETQFDNEKMVLNFIFKAFSDNTETIIKKFMDLISSYPTEENFNYAKLLTIEELNNGKDVTFDMYARNLFMKLMTGQTDLDYNDQTIENINYMKFDDFLYYHNYIAQNIKKIHFNIAGNINKELVKNIHDYIKEKIPLNNIRLLNEEPVFKTEEPPYVANYYIKSEMELPENGIIVAYEFPENYTRYIEIFQSCFYVIAFNYLRFNYTNAYYFFMPIELNFFGLFEQGLYKEVDKMEDDINKVLLDIFEGGIDVKNYKEILESYITKEEAKRERTLDNLFEEFIYGYQNNILNSDNFIVPKTFKELVKIIEPIFKEPKRTTILIARNTLSDDDFEKMYDRRSKIEEYILNNDIIITHTKNITPY